jgi:diguanylate cyclase (GGDEF)-like protein/PAS domain S-box-containing protein
VRDDDQFKRILDELHDGVYFLDPDRRITYWNKGAERITGYAADQVVGSRCSDDILAHDDITGRSLCDAGCPAACAMDDGKPHEADIFVHHRDGHRVPVHVRVSPLHSDDGDVIGAVETFSDDSPQVAALERLRELEDLVMVDPLTEVGNRRYAEAAIGSRLEELRRFGWRFGLLFIDVDRFKDVNDEHGHAIGDRMLRMVAATLAANVRSFDEVARYGGEEFVVVCPNVDAALLREIGERLRVLVERSGYPQQARPLQVTISIGGTLASPDDTVESIVERADELLYESKAGGRNAVRLG